MIQGRTFTISVKPAHHEATIEAFCDSMKGTAYVYAITHDRDTNEETGELIESHTHYLLEYETPRKLQTIANLFEVEANFVEVVKSKKAMLRYLIHLDSPDKFQYEPEQVISNNPIAFKDLIMGQNLTDKEIAEYIVNGKGADLLGVVSASKLRTIQSFLSFDRQGKLFQEMRKMNDKMDLMTDSLKQIHEIAADFQLGFTKSATQLIPYFKNIGDRLTAITEKALKIK